MTEPPPPPGDGQPETLTLANAAKSGHRRPGTEATARKALHRALKRLEERLQATNV